MPRVVRLPAHVRDGELRVHWDRDEDMGTSCIHAYGPRPDANLALSTFEEGEIEFRDDDARMKAFLQLGAKRGKSLVQRLEERGYDPRTLVFSIRRKSSPPPVEADPQGVADDILKRLEDAQSALRRLKDSLGRADEAKGVHILDGDEMAEIQDARTDAELALSACIDLLGDGMAVAD